MDWLCFKLIQMAVRMFRTGRVSANLVTKQDIYAVYKTKLAVISFKCLRIL